MGGDTDLGQPLPIDSLSFDSALLELEQVHREGGVSAAVVVVLLRDSGPAHWTCHFSVQPRAYAIRAVDVATA